MHKILVANRGEIAVRIIRACRDLALPSVAVFSESDRSARHVRMADEAYAIGPSAPSESYLRIDRLIDAARRSGADAVHPGYGFLAENAAFARACIEAGLTFIGPRPGAIALMGDKTAARAAAVRAGVPVVPGSAEPIAPEVSDQEIDAAAGTIGYPLMVKAVAGGGGKGMRVVSSPEQLPSAVRASRSEALSAFADAAIYLERRLPNARHIEVQLLADEHGTVIPFVERECSIQRRHQKVVEETPSPAVSPQLRTAITAAAVDIARAGGYTNAGTVEFLLDENGDFYFLEMNTRLQVEHPITEVVTGIDLVQWQIRIARGERLTISPGVALNPTGHALECRVYAEDPDAGFIPSPGVLTTLRAPAGPGVRDDSGVEEGETVPIFYDPLVSKLIAWGSTRSEATARMARALAEYDVVGIQTTIPFFRWLLRQPAFADGTFHTGYLDDVLQQRRGEPFSQPNLSVEEVAAVAAVLYATRPRIAGGVAMSPDGSGRWKEIGRREGLRG